MDPCRSSDIRGLLYESNVSDLDSDFEDDPDDPADVAEALDEINSGNEEEIELGIVDIHDLTDFSSGSDDNYSPHESELEASDRDECQTFEVDRPRPTHSASSSDNESVPRPMPRDDRPQWVRVYPPEPEFDPATKFQVRNPGIKNCPPKDSLPITYFNLFFTQAIWALLVRETNAYAAKVFRTRRDSGTIKRNSRIKRWTDVTITEMKRFIAIVLNMGLTVRKNIK